MNVVEHGLSVLDASQLLFKLLCHTERAGLTLADRQQVRDALLSVTREQTVGITLVDNDTPPVNHDDALGSAPEASPQVLRTGAAYVLCGTCAAKVNVNAFRAHLESRTRCGLVPSFRDTVRGGDLDRRLGLRPLPPGVRLQQPPGTAAHYLSKRRTTSATLDEDMDSAPASTTSSSSCPVPLLEPVARQAIDQDFDMLLDLAPAGDLLPEGSRAPAQTRSSDDDDMLLDDPAVVFEARPLRPDFPAFPAPVVPLFAPQGPFPGLANFASDITQVDGWVPPVPFDVSLTNSLTPNSLDEHAMGNLRVGLSGHGPPPAPASVSSAFTPDSMAYPYDAQASYHYNFSPDQSWIPNVPFNNAMFDASLNFPLDSTPMLNLPGDNLMMNDLFNFQLDQTAVGGLPRFPPPTGTLEGHSNLARDRDRSLASGSFHGRALDAPHF